MEDGITIKIAVTAESSVVADIGRLTFYETWRPVNTEEDMRMYLEKAFDERQIQTEVADQKTNLFLLALDGNLSIGYAKMRRDRSYPEFNNESAIELERIYVKQEHQAKKVGKQLMDRCIELAKSEKHQWLWLGVNDANHKAIDFYKKYGFEIFGTKMFKLGNAEDMDFLMKLKIG